jgi:predicted PurR-regulated permease PerM
MEARREPGRSAAALATAGRAAAATCGVLAVVLAAIVVWRSAALLALLYVSAIFAIVLERPVDALVRRGLGRAWALALVLGGVAAATAAIVGALGSLGAQVSALASAAPALADRLRASLVGALGSTPAGASLTRWLDDALSRGAGALAGGVVGAAGEVASAAGALVTVLVLALLFLASGPDLVRRAVGALPPARRPRAEALGHALAVALGGYLAGLATIVAARVLATAAFLALARIPFVFPLAMLAGVSVAIPYAGSVLRFLAIGAAAWATRGSGGALAALAFLAAYDVVENYLVSPIVYRRTVGVSAVGQILAVLFFGYHFGVVGAVLAIPLAASAQLVVRTLMSPAAPTSPGAAGSTSTAAEVEGSSARAVCRPQGEAPAAHPPEREAPSSGPSGD